MKQAIPTIRLHKGFQGVFRRRSPSPLGKQILPEPYTGNGGRVCFQIGWYIDGIMSCRHIANLQNIRMIIVREQIIIIHGIEVGSLISCKLGGCLLIGSVILDIPSVSIVGIGRIAPQVQGLRIFLSTQHFQCCFPGKTEGAQIVQVFFCSAAGKEVKQILRQSGNLFFQNINIGRPLISLLRKHYHSGNDGHQHTQRHQQRQLPPDISTIHGRTFPNLFAKQIAAAKRTVSGKQHQPGKQQSKKCPQLRGEREIHGPQRQRSRQQDDHRHHGPPHHKIAHNQRQRTEKEHQKPGFHPPDF